MSKFFKHAKMKVMIVERNISFITIFIALSGTLLLMNPNLIMELSKNKRRRGEHGADSVTGHILSVGFSRKLSSVGILLQCKKCLFLLGKVCVQPIPQRNFDHIS